MENKYHKNLTSEKWQGFSRQNQILNIAAEFSRAKNAFADKDSRQALDCLDRAFELLDLTIIDPRWKKGLKELLRFRGILAQFYIKKDKDINEFKRIFKTLLMFTKFTSMVKI